MSILVSADWGDDLAATYDSAVEAWLQAPATGARALYDTRVFPLACERMRDMRGDQEPLDLLYVPVGTQAYAPILAVLANPALCVALLESDASHAYGLLVEAALGDTARFIHVRIDPVDVLDISEKMRDVYDTRGLPRGARVAADVTGGRKTMTAAVAAVGSLLGWRLFYIEGTQERARDGLSHHERIIEIPNVLDVFGGRSRDLSLRLLRAGAWEAAASELEGLIAESGASDSDRGLLEVARAAGALREGDVKGTRRRFRRACQALGAEAPAALRLLAAAASGGPGETAAVLMVAADACKAEGHLLAAQALTARAAEHLDGVVSRSHPACEPHRASARELDRVLGRGLAAHFGTSAE